MKKNFKAFSLIEIIVAVLIISMILMTSMDLFIRATSLKTKLMEQTNLEKNVFYFSEKLFTLIKNGGTLDYEEYWNRKMIGTDVEKGHYKVPSGFGNYGKGGNIINTFNNSSWTNSNNYGNGFYYCLSGNGDANKIKDNSDYKGNGCSTIRNTSSLDTGTPGGTYTGQQRYGQYSFQFLDYNSNADNDHGDQDKNGNIRGDDDDAYLGFGPEAFEKGFVQELYLISGDKKKRTLIRYNLVQDPNYKKDTKQCSDIEKEPCIGKIQFLQLDGADWGMGHSGNSNNSLDGVVDTWVFADGFGGGNSEIAGTKNYDKYRKDLFGDEINISDFKIFAYPNIDTSKIWNMDGKEKYLTSPYVRLYFKVEPSRKIKSVFKGNITPIEYNTTINLTEVFSR